MKVFEVYSDRLEDSNGFEGENVRTVEREVDVVGGGGLKYEVKKHSFQGEYHFFSCWSTSMAETFFSFQVLVFQVKS